MPEDARVLRLWDMLRRREGSLGQRALRAVVAVALRLFFRRVETSGAGRVPDSGPVIFVLNHPNGLLDPALVFAALPRRISFLAKSTLFDLPVVGRLLRSLEALPLYRRVDGSDAAQNRRTFEACRDLLSRGRAVALFPEGVSHNAPGLLPVKTGAARIALGAASIGTGEGAAEGLKIVPVGLYYTSKTSFRGEALLRFGEPLEVLPAELDADGEPPRDMVRELSARIEEALRSVTVNAETEGQLDVARKAERLLSSVYEGLNVRVPLAERFVFLRRLTGWLSGRLAAGGGELARRVLRHEEELRRAGLSPENLQLSNHSGWYVFRHFLLRVGLIVAALPFSIPGAALHLPAYLLCTLLARLFPKHGVDEAGATVKILTAIVLMPLTWLAASGLAFHWYGWRAGVVTLPLAVACGYAAMRSLEGLYELRGWFKALFLLYRRRKLFLRLLVERKSLQDELERVGGG